MEWQSIESAPKDGSRFIAVMRYAPPYDKDYAVYKEDIIYWTNHNGGDWVGHVIGQPVLWMRIIPYKIEDAA